MFFLMKNLDNPNWPEGPKIVISEILFKFVYLELARMSKNETMNCQDFLVDFVLIILKYSIFDLSLWTGSLSILVKMLYFHRLQ